jgi:hypothetical protein
MEMGSVKTEIYRSMFPRSERNIHIPVEESKAFQLDGDLLSIDTLDFSYYLHTFHPPPGILVTPSMSEIERWVKTYQSPCVKRMLRGVWAWEHKQNGYLSKPVKYKG